MKIKKLNKLNGRKIFQIKEFDEKNGKINWEDEEFEENAHYQNPKRLDKIQKSPEW